MRKYTPIAIILFLLAGMLPLAACNMPSSETATPDAAMIITEAAATAAAELTRSAALNPQPTATPPVVTTRPSAQPTPTLAPLASTPAATVTPRATSDTASSGDAAGFVADVTVPDDTYAAPGAVFLKTWRVKNTGTTTWTPAYGLVWIQGEKMDCPEKIPVPNEVRPGEEVEISVTLTAPTEPGAYQTFFRFLNADGQYFGLDGSGDLWIKIIVGLSSTSTPTEGTAEATPTASQTPNS